MKTKDISPECQQDADKLCGVPPFDTFSNLVYGDGYFAKDRQNHYGEIMWAKACKEAERKKRIAKEAASCALRGRREAPSERIRRLEKLLKEGIKIVKARTSRSLSTNVDWLDRARHELKSDT